MPEGDVVLRSARRLHAALAGRVLTVSDLRWPSLATVDLTGRTVTEVVAAGKHLLHRLEGELTLHSHLRMEGSWHVHRTGRPWRGARSAHEIRAVLANAEWTTIGHKLGELDLVATADEGRLVGHLGPDVLGATWDVDAVAARIVVDPGRTIGETLLDQRVLAGIGTFWAAEGLFLRGVNPWTPAGEVPDVLRLLDLIRKMMIMSLEHAVQVTTGDARRGRENYVHARSGRPCLRCGTTVRVAPIGQAPTQRVMFWCPRCQPGPTPTDDGRPQAPLGARRR
ncbi:DNA-formamidopyrimidine glycosylase family protein [Spongisporangium articulatum]|uniref:DNA-(apurinic or apyrimidinic site) lyase n=1 Tax=Spongisporangium articulatum TaxID=3362603 RepID=A0ABW8AMP2_9ACTN